MPSTLPPFDRDLVIENLGGDEALLKQIAELFVADWPSSRDRILAAVAAADAEALRSAAHSVKGAVSNFAAERAVLAARTLEMAGKSGDLVDAAQLAAAAILAIEEVVAALKIEIAR